LRVLYTIAGLITLANGAWMLAAPRAWYLGLPAAVPDTGPFNAHFVRDLGVVYVVMSLGLAWCALHPDRCRPVHIGLTLLLGGHALLHVGDILAARLPSSHWLVDAPLVFAPAVLFALLAAPPVWRRVQSSKTSFTSGAPS